MKQLELVPISLAEANEFVGEYHRHHGPVRGVKFCLAASVYGKIVGVAIVGGPVARMLDDGWTLEVNRTSAHGTKNVKSLLHGACRRATFALGYRRLWTYTLALAPEQERSLVAAGWRCIGIAGRGCRSGQSRPRLDPHPTQQKLRLETTAAVPQEEGK
jgi:hypothetical protein